MSICFEPYTNENLYGKTRTPRDLKNIKMHESCFNSYRKTQMGKKLYNPILSFETSSGHIMEFKAYEVHPAYAMHVCPQCGFNDKCPWQHTTPRVDQPCPFVLCSNCMTRLYEDQAEEGENKAKGQWAKRKNWKRLYKKPWEK